MPLGEQVPPELSTWTSSAGDRGHGLSHDMEECSPHSCPASHSTVPARSPSVGGPTRPAQSGREQGHLEDHVTGGGRHWLPAHPSVGDMDSLVFQSLKHYRHHEHHDDCMALTPPSPHTYKHTHTDLGMPLDSIILIVIFNCLKSG